jgi:hypothetical protein
LYLNKISLIFFALQPEKRESQGENILMLLLGGASRTAAISQAP